MITRLLEYFAIGSHIYVVAIGMILLFIFVVTVVTSIDLLQDWIRRKINK